LNPELVIIIIIIILIIILIIIAIAITANSLLLYTVLRECPFPYLDCRNFSPGRDDRFDERVETRITVLAAEY